MDIQKDRSKKSGRVLAILLIGYGVLVASHDGGFWPFSIDQTFSAAGESWTRVLVRDVDQDVLLYRVTGSLSDSGTVQIQAIPIGLITPDSLLLNPASPL